MRAVCENRASIHLLEWGSGGTRLSHGRSKTERVELGAFCAVRPLSCLDPTFCTFLRQKVRIFGLFLLHSCNPANRFRDRLELFGYSCCTVTELSVGFLVEPRRQLSSEL